MHRFMEKLLDFKRGRVEDLGFRVEWRKLGEVAEVTIGEFVHQNKQNSLAKYPVYNGGRKPTGYYNEYNNTGNKIIVSARGANAGFVNKIYEPYWAGNSCYSISVKNKIQLDWEYIYYYLKSNETKLINSQQGGGGIPAISKKQMQSFLIPIPPLEVQREIVRILDNFTELTAELTAELSARRKQYSYYRDRLLSFGEDEVEWKKLGEATQLKRGKRLIKSQLNESAEYTVFQNSMTPLGYYHEHNVKSDTTFVISAGAAGEIGYSKDDFWAADDVYYFQTPDNIESKFLYYFLLTQQYKILAQVRRASIPRLSRTVIERLKIPIPPLEKQKEIVAILDKFDTLTNSISEGLPKEIELRQKQYEYYRDLLLDFPKEESCA